jgi:hypothetical protein
MEYLPKRVKLRETRISYTKKEKTYRVFSIAVPVEYVRMKEWKAGQKFSPHLTEEGIVYVAVPSL